MLPNPDRPVFDVANDNKLRLAFKTHATDIPASKAAARQVLEDLGVSAKISISVACQTANLPPERGWRLPAKRPRAPAPWKPRERRAANDNSPKASPLHEALRRDGREADVYWVMRYRALCAIVAVDPLHLNAGGGDEQGVGIETRSLRLSGKAFTRAFARMTSTKLPGGEISYRETRQTVKGIVSTGQRANATTDETGPYGRLTPTRFSEDAGNDRDDQIDGRAVLAEINDRLGWEHLASLEDAILGARTMTEIGTSMGFKHKAAPREGKTAVYGAIDSLREIWADIDASAESDAADCEVKVTARRTELAAAQAVYLGRAA